MAEYLIQDTTLDAIADAINAKTGGSSAMTPAQMVTAIGTISGGGDPYEKLIAVNNNTLTSLPAIQGLARIKQYMFAACTSLQEIDCSNITSLETYALFNTGVQELFFQNYITLLGNNAFRSMSSLKTVVFSKGAARFDMSLFEGCSRLTHIDLGTRYSYSTISVSAFYHTQSLQALILRPNNIIPIDGTFPSSSALASTAYIYVPSAYLSDYKEATNWSVYADRILAIEGSIYETQYADGTPIPSE